MEKQISNIKEKLKGMMTEENAFIIAEIGTNLDEIESEHKSISEKYSDLSESYINVVKNTTLADHSDHKDIEQTPKSLDDIMEESLKKVVNKK